MSAGAEMGLAPVLVTLTMGLVFALSGCGSNVVPRQWVGQAAGFGTLLDALLAVDSVEGFRSFAQHVVDPQELDGPVRELAAEARERIESLETLRGAGLIANEEFAEQVRGLIEDAAPSAAFAGLGFFGDPMGAVFDGTQAAALRLGAEQRRQARGIFQELHASIGALRPVARARIMELMSSEQDAATAALGVFDFGFLRPLVQEAGFVPSWPRGAGETLFDQVVQAVGLEVEQVEEFKMVREEFRSLVEMRHELGRDEFEAILDEVQLDMLDNLEM